MSDVLRDLLIKNHEKTVFKSLGIVVKKIDRDESLLSLKVSNIHRQHVGLVHGGIYTLLQESVASIAAASSLKNDKNKIVAIQLNANHIKSKKEGMIHARSKSIHIGARTMVYDAIVEDEKNKVLSTARVTLMVV